MQMQQITYRRQDRAITAKLHFFLCAAHNIAALIKINVGKINSTVETGGCKQLHPRKIETLRLYQTQFYIRACNFCRQLNMLT